MDNQSVRTIDPLPPLQASRDGSLRISLLGGLKISQGDVSFGPERFRLRKACSLVKLMALAPTHRLQHDQILEWLWPDGDPEASDNSLHQALRSARQVLEAMQPPCYIHFEDEFLCLHSNPPLWVDVRGFRSRSSPGRSKPRPLPLSDSSGPVHRGAAPRRPLRRLGNPEERRPPADLFQAAPGPGSPARSARRAPVRHFCLPAAYRPGFPLGRRPCGFDAPLRPFRAAVSGLAPVPDPPGSP